MYHGEADSESVERVQAVRPIAVEVLIDLGQGSFPLESNQSAFEDPLNDMSTLLSLVSAVLVFIL